MSTEQQIIGDRFVIARFVAVGGMGKVYRARDIQTGAEVALKVLATEAMTAGVPANTIRPAATDADVRALHARFAREARILARIRHPAIVRYVAHGTAADGSNYLAMEWLEGETLSARFARGALSVVDSVAIGRRIAAGLGALHEAGIVHRDVKPGNVVLVGKIPGRATLLDLGIAREGPSELTAFGLAIGTHGYMAPEQARGSLDIDARADVYALGCVLFKALTGTLPFEGDDVLATLGRTLFEDAPDLGDLSPEVPQALAQLVSRMLAKDPLDRPADGRAVARELEDLDSGAPSTRKEVPPLSKRTLTRDELQLVSVIAVSPTLSAREGADREARAHLQKQVEATAAAFRARVEWLADGSLLALVTPHKAATDQAARAGRCALALRAVLHNSPTALATGRAELTGKLPVGDALARAAKLLQQAQAVAHPLRSGVRVDTLTAGLLGDRFEIHGDVSSLELVREREVSETARNLLGRPSPYVGRDREIAFLNDVYEECVHDSVGRAVIVTAPPGHGKSRLRFEFLKGLRARDERADPWVARGDPISAGAPFGLVAQVLRHALGLVPSAPLTERQHQLRGRVAFRVQSSEVDRIAEFLGEVAGTPLGPESPALRAARRDSMLMKDQIHRAWEDFLLAECTATPVVIVLEDMHWGDLPSIHLFDAALNRLRDHPFLLLALARLEVDQAFPELWATRNVTRIGLGRLSKNASRRLAREMLGAAPSDEAIDRLVDRADGHAFFLEELIRAASRREEAPPETVLAMLQARVAALGAEARLVLRAASIFGHAFFSSGIMALVGSELDRASVHDALQQLSEEELVARRTSMPDEEYVFRHALLREAVYAMLTDEDRATGHRLAARWLERRPDTSSLVLAEHFERGGDRARAAEHYLRAAEQSLEGNDLASAIALGEKAVACGASGATLGAVRLTQAAAHRWRGNFAASKICGAEAMRCLEPGSARWYRAAAEVGTGEGVLGANDTLVELAQTLLVTPSCGNVAPARIAALASVVPQLVRIGRVELADLLLEAAASARSELASPEPVAEARFHEARAVRLTYAGDPTAFLDETRRVAELFEEGGDKRGACLARAHHGYGLAAVGAYAAAEAVLRDALAESERLGLTLPASSAKHNLGPVLLRRGAIDEARRVETEAVIEGMKEGNARFESASRIYLAAIEMAAGDLAGAEHEARRAVTLLQPNTPLRGWALATLADVLLASGRLDEALACTEEARNVFRAVGGVGEGEGVVYLVCAKTLHAAGDDETARKAIRQARARLMQRASTIADEEVRARFLEDVPENRATLELAGAWLGK